MRCRTQSEGLAMQTDGLVNILCISPLLDPLQDARCKIVEGRGPIWMGCRTQTEGPTMQTDGLVNILCISPLL
jgi:hypothetical protein